MTTGNLSINEIVEENTRRYKALCADYDPVTGEDAPLKRVELHISDFAIPVQYIPEKMMRVKLIRLLSRYGSIRRLLKEHPFNERHSALDIERQIRRIRHKYDFCFWAYFQIHIIDKTGNGEIRFKLNYAQIKIFEQ